MLVTVGIEDDRALAELLLKAIRIQLGLTLTFAWIALGALGLDQSQRLAVIAPQHVIDEAFALIVRHASDAETRDLPSLSKGQPASRSSRSMKASRVCASS